MVLPEKSGLHWVRKVMAAKSNNCLVGSWKFGSGAGEKGQNFECLDFRATMERK